MLIRVSIISIVVAAAVLLSGPSALAAPPDYHASFACTFDDNVTRAGSNGSKLADRSCSADLGRPFIFPIAGHARVVLTGIVGGELFDLNPGLNRLSSTLQGELQYRSSAEFGTPTYALFTRATADRYRSHLRDGFRVSTGVSMREDLTDRVRFFGAVSHNRRHGSDAVFDDSDNSARFSLDYTPGLSGAIYLGGEYRRGDLVIAAPESWSASNAGPYVRDDAFTGRDIYSFRFGGSTMLTTLGYNIKTGPRSAVDLSWRQARTAVDYVTPSLRRASASYVVNQLSLAYLLRFQ